MRTSVEASWLTRAQPLPSEGPGAVASVLGQSVLHMQFTNGPTRVAILEALHWWRGGPISAAAPSSVTSRPTTCAALASGTAPKTASRLSAVIASSALSPSALLCLLPGPRNDDWNVGGSQDLHLPQSKLGGGDGGSGPCCWKVDELQRAAARAVSVDAEAASAEAKALGKARKYAGCRIWRRFA